MDVQVHRVGTQTLLEALRGAQALSPQEGMILEALALMRGRYMSSKRLVTMIYGDREDGGPIDPENVIRVQVHNLRHKMPALKIENRSGWGYRIAC